MDTRCLPSRRTSKYLAGTVVLLGGVLAAARVEDPPSRQSSLLRTQTTLPEPLGSLLFLLHTSPHLKRSLSRFNKSSQVSRLEAEAEPDLEVEAEPGSEVE